MAFALMTFQHLRCRASSDSAVVSEYISTSCECPNPPLSASASMLSVLCYFQVHGFRDLLDLTVKLEKNHGLYLDVAH